MPTYHPRYHCPISGLQDSVVCCRLFPVTEEGVELDEDKACIPSKSPEWNGYGVSPEEAIFRPDIANLYVNHEFALVPTFKTYLELLKFANHAGVLDRDEDDMSPRRPLTAFASPSGRYRYAYVPLTDAARELQKEFPMAPQTEDDLNGGNDPIFNTPMEPGTDDYPIVECYAHPFSVSYFANHTLNFHLTHCPPAFRQWLPILITIFRLWTAPDLVVPQWFIDSPAREDDDATINDSERLGYVVPSLPNPLIRDPLEIDNTLKVDPSENPEPRVKVFEWFLRTRQPCALRRALRNKKRSSLDRPRPAARRRRKGSPAYSAPFMNPPISDRLLPSRPYGTQRAPGYRASRRFPRKISGVGHAALRTGRIINTVT
ncbi:hypothetical protein K525DRAFT_287269 [Schizophyllum commune Loenen D]|nr:hypothetical protein K525DRAFT_287269 [Schizophyllum commune Loenen D]